jgi:hypothetical protein
MSRIAMNNALISSPLAFAIPPVSYIDRLPILLRVPEHLLADGVLSDSKTLMSSVVHGTAR